MNLLIKNVILPDGDGLKTADIAVTDGIIAKIGKVGDDFVSDEIIDGKNRLAMPAFVNAHTHMYMSTLRNAADDLPFMEWLFNGVMPKEDRLDGEQAYWALYKDGAYSMTGVDTTPIADGEHYELVKESY